MSPVLCIVGLGNPGNEYKNTRHNVGFLSLNAFAQKHAFPEFSASPKFFSEISEMTLQGKKIILVKPQTFMNLSGKAVLALKQFYKLNAENFIFLYDDKDMEFGKIRIRKEGSSGGHNGVKSIIEVLGTSFLRIKIGVASPLLTKMQNTSDFVLGKFTEEEQNELQKHTFPAVLSHIHSHL